MPAGREVLLDMTRSVAPGGPCDLHASPTSTPVSLKQAPSARSARVEICRPAGGTPAGAPLRPSALQMQIGDGCIVAPHDVERGVRRRLRSDAGYRTIGSQLPIRTARPVCSST